MSRSAVILFRLVQGEYVFDKILNHLGLTEDEFTREYGEKLEKDCNCLNGVIVEIMRKNLRRLK